MQKKPQRSGQMHIYFTVSLCCMIHTAHSNFGLSLPLAGVVLFGMSIMSAA